MMMKKIEILIRVAFWAFCCLTVVSCSKSDLELQEENDKFIPRIFYDVDNDPFPTDGESLAILSIGQELAFTGLQYSPSDRVSISWKIDDVEVSTAKEYTFVATQPGEYKVSVEASYDGFTNSRQRTVYVLPPSGSYDRKPYTHVVLSYLTQDLTISGITSLRWDDITHVAYKTATISPTGMVDYTPGFEGRKIDYLVSRAHDNGVPVLLGISGELSADGWNVYGSTHFVNVLSDPAKIANIVQSVASYIAYYNMDGIEIRMADVGHDTDPPYQAAVQGVISLVNELRGLLGPDAIITLSIPSPTLNRTTGAYSTWVTRAYTPTVLNNILPQVDWLNIRAYSQSGYWGAAGDPPVGHPLGQPSSFELMQQGVNYWKNLVPTNKLVMGMPAIGIRHLYTTTDQNGVVRSGGWGATNFNFMPYRDIVAQAPSAYNNDFTPDIAHGVYYNGVQMVRQKAQLLKDEGFLGSYLWGGNYDPGNVQTSLTRAIAETLR